VSATPAPAGRRSKKDPHIVQTLTELVQPATGGEPMSQTKYVRRSLQTLSDGLRRQGHTAGPDTVADLLRELGYNLHVNIKRFTGPAHPDRDRQFRYIEEMVACFTAEGWPIVSVDTKKKELIGDFKNPGVIWCRRGDEVNAHDFLQDAQCRAVPYGLYDCLANRGHVVVGTSADTPAFAVDAIASWWGRIGSRRYPEAGALLILADAGGSNGCRPRLWKKRLQETLADRYGLVVTVCHYPTGASKWNPVEHRLFGPISTNWAGTPLRSPEVMLACLRGTQTRTGLRVTAAWQPRLYPKGVKVSNAEMAQLHILKHDTCPQWNYTIEPSYLWN
jgi:Rhodopirellula transposase DDE domain